MGEEQKPAGGEQKPDEGKVLFNTVVPKEFHDRPYLKDILGMPVGPEAYNEVFKKLDGAEKLVGKKIGIPDSATASKEDWDQFYAKLRPETPDAYEFKVEAGAPAPDENFVKGVKSIFHKAGLTKHQAAVLQADFNAMAKAQSAEQQKAAAALDQQFEELTAKTFGAENAEVLAKTKEMINTFTPENLKPYVAKLPNESLVVLAGILNGVRTKYMKEDNLNNAGGKPAGTDPMAAREEARKLMALPEYKDAFHPKHNEVVAKINAVYAALPKEGVKK